MQYKIKNHKNQSDRRAYQRARMQMIKALSVKKKGYGRVLSNVRKILYKAEREYEMSRA